MTKISNIKIGLIARADLCGVGNQTHDIFTHLNPTKTLVIRGEHAHRPERYTGEGVTFTDGVPSDWEMDQLSNGVDVVYTVETPYNWNLINICRQKGVKTVIAANYEFMINLKDTSYPVADFYIMGSEWNHDKIPYNKAYIPVPVDREVLPFKKREKIESFYHIAGHQLFEDRNGTNTFLEALRWMKTKPPIKIYTQHDLGVDLSTYPNVELIGEVENYWDMHTADCLILPRRYGPQSLQMQEALSCGIPVIMPRVSPQNEILPDEMMIDPQYVRKIDTQGGIIDCADIDSQRLAIKMDELYNSDISGVSEWCNEYAESISWPNLKPKYEKLMEDLCKPKD